MTTNVFMYLLALEIAVVANAVFKITRRGKINC